MKKTLKKIFPDPSVKLLKKLTSDVENVNKLEPEIKKLSDEELKAKTIEFQKRVEDGESLDDLLHEAFAVVREAAMRTLGQRHYDVQLVGGMTMHLGNIAEMRTGEGKTLTATLALYLNGLSGKGAHLVTVNDYLARRDTVWVGQVLHFLGLSVGCIQHESGFIYDPEYRHEEDEEDADEERDKTGSFKVDMDYLRPVSRGDAYAADVTYGTNNEFGFDYLRDNMVGTLDQKVQRELNFAIVDEVDSILIDEARTPLIISAPSDTPSELYYKFSHIASTLKEETDYNIDEKMKVATLTDVGISKVEEALGVDNLYTEKGVEFVHHIEEALRAHVMFQIDVDYVIRDGEIVIVDEFTGRMMEGRRYSGGLHQAIEAKENVEIKRESQTLATVTFQNFFRLYDKLAGMTGTAETDAEEFQKTYGMDVLVIPTNKPTARDDAADRVYSSEKGKLKAVVADVKALQEKGQPVLIGTVSIEDNERVHNMFTAAGIMHEVLNAKNHEREATIIAQAGHKGSVTIATNMAGRGVDIILGGNPSTEAEQKEVKSLGGLHVIGTERHESRRIDNQLRGRSGRQGDKGSTQFYVSMEDSLMRVFGSDKIKGLMEKMGIPEDMPIENKMVSRSIEKAQERVEGHHFDSRKHLLSYDDVLNKHREVVYRERREILEAYDHEDDRSLRKSVLAHFDEALEEVVAFHTGDDAADVPEEFKKEGLPEKGDNNTREILETINAMVELSDEERGEVETLVSSVKKGKADLAENRTEIIEKLLSIVERHFDEVENEFDTRKELKDIEKAVILRSTDRLWIDHLEAMTALRQGIGLRGYGQRDPLVEYKRESFGLFNRLILSVSTEVAASFFKITKRMKELRQAEDLARTVFDRAGVTLSAPAKTSGAAGRAAAAIAAGANQTVVNEEKVGRNDPCPCGSGKKYKKCHGK